MFTVASNRVDDLVGGLRPFKRFGVLVPELDLLFEGAGQVVDRAEDATVEPTALQFGVSRDRQTRQRLGTSAGLAVAGAAFFATLRGHGSYVSAYRNGIFVTAAITAVAPILTLTDRHRAANETPTG